LTKFLFFPTPYPDEILYSVLCRYHIRNGIPKARQTNLEIWSNIYGKKLHLPDGIESITERIPQSANLTTDMLIKECTALPLLKPFVIKSIYDELFHAMKYGNKNIYNIVSFSKTFTMQHWRLRYCPQCIERDREIYGEPYWHRIHQMPGVFICPIHNDATVESNVSIDELKYGFSPLLPETQGSLAPIYEQEIAVKLFDYSCDMAWLAQHGYDMQNFERTDKLYDNRLRVRGYRTHGGKTASKKLAQDIVHYYGATFLSMFNAYNSGACLWIKRIVQHNNSFRHPLYHLLLMRFLSGSVEGFFTNVCEKPPEYLPYGSSPYPCRNYLCEYHLQDVIVQIEVKKSKGTPYATFLCPHCGFAYNRKGIVPKEQQYSGQIHITSYGWKWEESVSSLLSAEESPYKIAREFHCDVRTIIKFGIERGILSEDRLIGRIPYAPSDEPKQKHKFETTRSLYRKRWLDAIAANPAVTRNELRLLDAKADQWLHLHDAEWLEQNSPLSKKAVPTWATYDDEYFEKVKNAVKQIRETPGKPRRISFNTIGKIAGISKPAKKLASDYLPKTKAFVADNIDTLEQWQRRKIVWAVEQLRGRGEILTIYKVRHAATISDPERRQDNFILKSITDSE